MIKQKPRQVTHNSNVRFLRTYHRKCKPLSIFVLDSTLLLKLQILFWRKVRPSTFACNYL